MKNVLDIIVIAIILLWVYIGYKKGLIKSVFDLISTITSLIAANVISNKYAPTISENFTSKLSDVIIGKVTYDMKNDEGVEAIEKMGTYLEKFGLSSENYNKMVEQGAVNVNSLKEAVMESIGDDLSLSITKLVIFVLSFFVITFILGCVISLIDAFFTFPVLNEVNKFFGIGFGFVNGIIIVFIICMIIKLALAFGFFSGNEIFSLQNVSQTFIFKWFFNSGLLTGIFGG